MSTALTKPDAEELTDEQLDMVAVQEDLLARHATIEQQRGDADWLPPWYLARVAECDAVQARIKEQTKALLGDVESRRQALARCWGAAFQAQVDSDLEAQGGKKKSINYSTGKAGYRKSRERLAILDDAEFITWAKMECPDCLEYRVARKTPAVEHMKETGELPPGTALLPAEDQFYPLVAQPTLPDVPSRRLTHGGSDDDE